METPLNASSTTAGALFASGRFRVPEFQREFAWGPEEVDEFFSDLAKSLHDESYFLGLVILTGTEQPKEVVDGQQRLLTITLLAAAIFREAKKLERNALAERMQSTFLRFIDFDSDEERARLELSSATDDATLQAILQSPASELTPRSEGSDTSSLLVNAYRALSKSLVADLGSDPFKRLGLWADFLTNRLYLATFVHPDSASAYRVFEVINTRGKELTTADLLKSYVLSQTPPRSRRERYDQWQAISGSFGSENAASFVQFIRHAVTTAQGPIEARELYDALSSGIGGRSPMGPEPLMSLLESNLPLYRQILDPTSTGPASDSQLRVFSLLARLNVVSVRPILLALANTPNGDEGAEALLRLVVRRVVVGNLGTGNVERRFGLAAQRVERESAWAGAFESLEDLNPSPEDFELQVHRRGLNRNVLTVVRQSVIQATALPDPIGFLYYIKPRDSAWSPEDEDRVSAWAYTIGNTVLAEDARRPMSSSTWFGFKEVLLPRTVEGEWVQRIESFADWNIEAISTIGTELARRATRVWYP